MLNFLGKTSSFLVISSVFTYLEYEVSTKFRTIYEIPTQFPRIAICNNMPFQTEYAVEFLKKIVKEKNVSNIFDPNEMSRLNFSEKSRLIDFVYNQGLVEMNSIKGESTKKKLGHNINDIFISCMFNQEQCFIDDFEWSFQRLKKMIIFFQGKLEKPNLVFLS